MNNTQRSLKGVVSVDGWIAKFDRNDTATVHVDIVFREGHFGAEGSDKIRFRICLTRAEIILRVPDGEPLRIVKSSIARTPLPEAGTRETVRKMSGKASAGAKFKLSTSKAPTAEIAAELAAAKEVQTTEKLKERLTPYLTQHFTSDDGHPAWDVSHCETGTILQGTPWDAQKDPRLKVKRETALNADGDKPSLKVEIRCRREDIHIEGLEAKDEKAQWIFLKRANSDVNLAAAEQLIKEELLKAGFMRIGNLAEGFTEVLVADAILTEEW